jgi:hypothetical protein
MATNRKKRKVTEPIKVTQRVETITPEKAVKYLEYNPHNRSITKSAVNRYLEAMLKGEWWLTGQGIIFDEDGNLLDGQHRLTACIEAGVPFITSVTRGINAEAWKKMDMGKSRTDGHRAQAAGYANANRVAAAARTALEVESADQGANRSAIGRNKRVDPDVLLSYIEQHHDLLQEGCLAVRHDQGPAILKPPAVFVALFVLFAQRNKTRAREFFEAVTTGEILSKEDAAYRLRAVLISNLSKRNVRAKKIWLIGVTIKAWNAHLAGKAVKQLKFGESEKFPTIRSRKK